MIEYRFTPDDIAEITRFAHLRNDPKVAAGVQTRRFYANRGELQTHMIGLRGELAAARVLGVPIDRAVHLDGDAGYDLIHRGRSIDVKTRPEKYRDLAFKSVDDFRADLALLVWLEDERMESSAWVVGWIAKRDFALSHRKQTWTAGKVAHYIPWRELTPVELLVSL